jgi:hypothetical protein
MKIRQFAKVLWPVTSLGAVALALVGISHSNAETEESLSRRGLKIAPVPLNLEGKNSELVGYGSYIVNAQIPCNDCHSNGPAMEFAPGGNPYFSQMPEKLNPDTYLGGGRDFGQLIPGTANIISRNLTPDKTGMPAGGMSLQDFMAAMKTGADHDNLHPACNGAPGPNCLLPPFDGKLLQIMPWPLFSHMTDRDLRAIYAYLSSVPCQAGPPAPSNLHNECK